MGKGVDTEGAFKKEGTGQCSTGPHSMLLRFSIHQVRASKAQPVQAYGPSQADTGHRWVYFSAMALPEVSLMSPQLFMICVFTLSGMGT